MAKAPDAFRTISEVSELLDTPPHVLRFWESRFSQVRPVKRAGGRRYYRPADLLLLGGIKRLLHDDGMTIRGVQKMLSDQGVPHVAALADPGLLAANDGTAPGTSEAAPSASARPDSEAPDATATEADAPLPDAKAGPSLREEEAGPSLRDEEAGPSLRDEEAGPSLRDEKNIRSPSPEDAPPPQAPPEVAPDVAPAQDAPAEQSSDAEAPEAEAAKADPAAADAAPVPDDAEADLLALIRAAAPGLDGGPPDTPRSGAADDPADTLAEPEDRAMPEPHQPAPEATAPTLAQVAARLRHLGPDDIAGNRAEIEALRARLLLLHKARSERLVAARF